MKKITYILLVILNLAIVSCTQLETTTKQLGTATNKASKTGIHYVASGGAAAGKVIGSGLGTVNASLVGKHKYKKQHHYNRKYYY